MANETPAFPFYVDDFLADKNVQAMTLFQTGVYIRLICFAWKEEQTGTLPDDDDLFASLAKLSMAKWKANKDKIMRAFYYGDGTDGRPNDGRWHQKRLEKEHQKQVDRRERLAQAGRKGGKKPGLNKNKPGLSDDKASLGLSSSISSSLKGTTATGSKPDDPPPPIKLHPDFPEACKAWQAEIGIASTIITDQINDWLLEGVPLEWITHAVEEAVTHEARNLAYIKTIIERRKKGGKHKQSQGKKVTHGQENADMLQPYLEGEKE